MKAPNFTSITREIILPVRFTKAEHNNLKELAKNANMGVSTICYVIIQKELQALNFTENKEACHGN